MSTFKQLVPADIKEARSFLNQLVDVVQQDISGSSTRKKYQVFVTGGVGPGVTLRFFRLYLIKIILFRHLIRS